MGREGLGLGGEGGLDDRLGRPTSKHFHKSWVSKQASVSRNQKNLNEVRHLLSRNKYCCVTRRAVEESGPFTKRSNTVSFHSQNSFLLKYNIPCFFCVLVIVLLVQICFSCPFCLLKLR